MKASTRIGRHGARRVGAAVFLLFLAWCGQRGYGQNFKQQLDSRLAKLGERLAQERLYESQAKTPLEKARYVYTEYCRTLQVWGAGVNATYAARLSNGYRNGDQNLLTCGWHNDKLKALFARMGIAEGDMASVVADDDAAVQTINSEHGGLAVKNNDGKVYFFDPWQMAVQNSRSGTSGKSLYEGAENSKWNGMAAGDWEAEMRRQGYVRFTDSLQRVYMPDVGSTLLRLGITAPTGSWSGTWGSRPGYGKQLLLLKQYGRRVTGTYTDPGFDPPQTGSCEGEVDRNDPNKLVGTFTMNAHEVQGMAMPAYTRTIKWTLKEKGKYFDSNDGNAGIWYMWRK